MNSMVEAAQASTEQTWFVFRKAIAKLIAKEAEQQNPYLQLT